MTSRAWYVVAAAVLAAGTFGAGWIVWSELAGISNALTWVVVPGEQVLTLAETGLYTIYHETELVIDGKVYSIVNIHGLKVTISGEDGTPILVTAAAGSTRYSFSQHQGISAFAFAVDKPGRYRLAAAYDDGRTGPSTVLAVGRDFVLGLVASILGSVGLALGSFFIALALTLVTFLKRRRLRRLGALA